MAPTEAALRQVRNAGNCELRNGHEQKAENALSVFHGFELF